MIPVVILFSKKRRTISLKVDLKGEVTVRAPEGTSMEVIREFVNSREQWILKNRDRLKARNDMFESADREKLVFSANYYIPRMVEHYAKKMSLSPTGVKITSAKTRYGSCSGKNSLCFSMYLMFSRPCAIDAVIVHELAHIKYKNHSPEFYAYIEKYMPDYKERIKLLK